MASLIPESLGVRGKVILVVALAAAFAAAGVLVTALLTSLATALAIWGALLALVLAIALFAPVRTDDLVSHPAPAASYEAAVARFAHDATASPEPLSPLCHPLLLGHGARTPTAVVLLHGISSCPRAFVDFAPMLHARGHTVVALRMPENGYADRATDALKRLTAEQLARWGDLAVDIAAGLGEEVVVLGISAGGTTAGWICQNREDVARVVLVAPMFGLAHFGGRLNRAIMRVALYLPPFSIWKDPRLRERYEGMPHAYKRQSSRGTGEVLRLAYATVRQARAGPASARALALVTNANDGAVDNALARRVADLWEGRGLPVTRFTFAKEHGLGHELIDPLEPGADPRLTYPILVRLIEGRDAGHDGS